MAKSSEDIMSLIKNKARESETLDYKEYRFETGKFGDLTDKEKKNLFKEIVAFANAQGGDIVIGVAEDGDKNPSSCIETGINATNFETWEQSFRNILSTRTRPAIYGVHCEPIVVEEKNIIWISVPRSIHKPHAYTDQEKINFYIRDGNIKKLMSYDGIKYHFSLLEGLQARVRDIRDTRISMFLNDEILENISDKSGVMLHIIPEWSLNDENYIDITKNIDRDNFPALLGSGFWSEELYNPDGVMLIYEKSSAPYFSYVQMFQNGVFEAFSFFYKNDINGTLINLSWLEQSIAEKIWKYCSSLQKLGVPHEFYIYLTLINVKGKSANVYNEPVLTRNIIKMNLVKWNESLKYPVAIKPMLDNLANTFGIPGSSLYDDNHNPKEDKFKFCE